jgi:hypothetical protein
MGGWARRRTWRVTGIKRTRTHSIKLLADTAEEAIRIAANYRIKVVTSCVEEFPVRLPGGGWYHGMLAENDPRYASGWNFIGPACLAPRRTEEQPPETEAPLAPTSPDP